MEFVDSDGFIRGCLTTLEVVELRVLVIMPRCHVGTQSGPAIASRVSVKSPMPLVHTGRVGGRDIYRELKWFGCYTDAFNNA